MFMDAIKETLNEDMNYSMTENGALGYCTTGKSLLDLNFSVSSLRSASEQEIINKFMKAFCEDKILAMRWLFFARDIKQGLGERRLFRVIVSDLVRSNPEMVLPVIKLFSYYGRWDDMWCLLDIPMAAKAVYDIVDKQLTEDLKNMNEGKSISLLGKWMPSTSASSNQTKRYAKQLRKALSLTEQEYRKILSKLRKYLDVVEVKMSAKNWSEINYETVPSRANLIYNNAFLRNDEERRRDYLSKLEKGETKINASTLYPHDIVHKYTNGSRYPSSMDATLESLWKALPDNVNGCGNTIVVADGSGSMGCRLGNTNVTALSVANALAIYFAERSSGEFKDKYITFSERPQFVDFSNCSSLHAKIQTAAVHNEIANTNIEAVFDLILKTAINNNMTQEEIPQNILIVSDMEFDSCATCGASRGWYSLNRPDQRLFAIIAKKYENAGYKLPRLIFWNVNSRTGTIPIKENELGVALVSGFSTNICKMVLSGELDPYKCLLEMINSERYDAVEQAIKEVI